MTEYIFTGILESYRKDEISIDKAKRQIRLLLDPKDTSDVVNKNDLLHDVGNNEPFSKVAVCLHPSVTWNDDLGMMICDECNCRQ